MNRIVIIGNGFDISHGLKTRYEDFLLDYLIESIEKAKESETGTYEDRLVIINHKKRPTIDVNFDSISRIMESDFIGFTGLVHDKAKPIHFTFKSDFLNDILTKRLKSVKNWSDLESEYFRFLYGMYTERYKDIKDKMTGMFTKLNSDLIFLKERLHEYLIKEENKIDENFVLANSKKETINKCFKPLDVGLFFRFFHTTKEHPKTPLSDSIDGVYFFNFNYTSLLNYYNIDENNIIHIHGKLDNIDSMIFGYGDDTHKGYKELEDEAEDEFLKNMKSINYSAYEYYHRLNDILNSLDFEVQIIGHSMGLSDRVLLKSIFEHPNCKAIRLYHRGNRESYRNKALTLSRHYSNKLEMRQKIINYNENDILN